MRMINYFIGVGIKERYFVKKSVNFPTQGGTSCTEVLKLRLIVPNRGLLYVFNGAHSLSIQLQSL